MRRVTLTVGDTCVLIFFFLHFLFKDLCVWLINQETWLLCTSQSTEKHSAEIHPLHIHSTFREQCPVWKPTQLNTQITVPSVWVTTASALFVLITTWTYGHLLVLPADTLLLMLCCRINVTLRYWIKAFHLLKDFFTLTKLWNNEWNTFIFWLTEFKEGQIKKVMGPRP